MKITFLMLLFALTLSFSANAQMAPASAAPATATDTKPKRQIFRANKDQIIQVQTMLKAKSLYGGEATGKLDDTTRVSIKNFQKDNGLRQTGTLNRATLEKMGIELTTAQKAIPVSENSYASTDAKKDLSTAGDKPKKVIFRATKDQIGDAQKMLKSKGMFSGDETGKLDDATRDALKKYQTANGLKVTGTLNQATLDKMGIGLTDKQKTDAAGSQK